MNLGKRMNIFIHIIWCSLIILNFKVSFMFCSSKMQSFSAHHTTILRSRGIYFESLIIIIEAPSWIFSSNAASSWPENGLNFHWLHDLNTMIVLVAVRVFSLIPGISSIFDVRSFFWLNFVLETHFVNYFIRINIWLCWKSYTRE